MIEGDELTGKTGLYAVVNRKVFMPTSLEIFFQNWSKTKRNLKLTRKSVIETE